MKKLIKGVVPFVVGYFAFKYSKKLIEGDFNGNIDSCVSSIKEKVEKFSSFINSK